MNGDGLMDLVLGQLRRIDNGQDELASRVVLNDGTGSFRWEKRGGPTAGFV